MQICLIGMPHPGIPVLCHAWRKREREREKEREREGEKREKEREGELDNFLNLRHIDVPGHDLLLDHLPLDNLLLLNNLRYLYNLAKLTSHAAIPQQT